MKLARTGDGRTLAVHDEDGTTTAVDLRDAARRQRGCGHASVVLEALGTSAPDDWRRLIAQWPAAAESVTRVADTGRNDPRCRVGPPLDLRTLAPPLPSPRTRIFAGGMNFAAHVDAGSRAVAAPAESQAAPGQPAGFFVVPGSVVGPDVTVHPPATAQCLDYEVEVAAVLATGGRHLAPDQLRFWGWSAFNDLSIRDPHLGLSRLDQGTLSWALQKNFDGGNVLGPWIAVDPNRDLSALSLALRVNGTVRQRGATTQMIHSFAEIAAYVSQYVTLEPGDMITSGTPEGTAIEHGPGGPYLQAGDVVEAEVEGVGALRTTIGAASGRAR